MNWQYTPFTLPLFMAAAISAGLAFYAWKRRAAVGAKPFALLMLAVAEWSLVYALRLGSTDLPTKLFWAKVRYLGIVTVPTAWLVFVLQYTGREKWLTPRNVTILSIEPLVTLLSTWTNDRHGLHWSSIRLITSGSLLVWNATYGVTFWFHVVYTYLLLLLSTYLLLQTFIRSPRLHRGQTGVLLVSGLIPLVGDVLSTYDLIPFPLDLTPFTFTAAGLLIAWGLFHFRLFDVVPMARSAVVGSMSDGLIVLDIQNRIVDINPIAQNIIGLPASEVVGQPLARLATRDRSGLIEQYHDVTEAHDEVAVGEGKAQRHYDLRISPIHDQRGRLGGRLIVLHDITELKQAQADLMAQKQLFESVVAMARAAAKPTSLEATLQGIVNMATMLTGAEHGSVFLLDGTGTVTHSVLARGEAPQAQQQEIVGRVMEEGLAGWVVHHRRPALVSDTSLDNRWVEVTGIPYTRSALSIPIVSGSAVSGVLTLMHPKPNYFNTEHAYLIQSSTDQMMLAMRNAQMYDEQRRLAGRQTTLYEALRTVGGHLDPETITRAAVEAIARLTNWPAVAILLPDDTATHLVVPPGAGVLSATESQRLSVDQGVTGRAFRTAQTQHVPDVDADPDYVRGNPAIRSELAVPLRRGERVLGVLDVASDRPAAFNDDDVLLAKSLAEAIALALDNARLYTETRQYAANLSTLYTVARSISRSLVLEDVLSETLDSALTSLGFDAGLISLADPSDGHLYVAAERGLPPAMSDRLRQEGLAETLCAYVHTQSEAAAVSDIEQETPIMSKLEQDAPLAVSEMRSLGIHAFSCIPLLHQDRSLGALSLFAFQTHTISAKDEALQMTIGRQIATAVTNARLFQAIADERSRLQALIESSRDGIILIGTDQRTLVVNAPALTFLHLTGRPSEWVNRPIQDALTVLEYHSPRAVQVILGEMHRARMEDWSPGEGEYEIPPRAIHWMSLPVMAGTIPLGQLVVLRDVTEERLLERMRDDLVHAMVHDLRNPLTAIYGALSFLSDTIGGELSSTQQQLWQIAQDNTEGMLKLIKAILEISQLESRRMPLEPTLIPLGDLVAGVLELQLPLAAEKDIHLKSDVPSTLPMVWADAELIERVLQNLVSNAIKFTPSGGEVQVIARADTIERSRIHVSVSDTGSGIPPEIQDRLFQKFVTGEQQGRGSGLGLAFCKMVMEAHSQLLWVDDTSEAGTTFTFTLPLPPAMGS